MEKEFGTCWDDDQIKIYEWITEQLHKNPCGLFKVTVRVEEIEEKEEIN